MGTNSKINLIRQPNKTLVKTMDGEVILKFLLFILWPVGGFLFSLFRPASKSSYVIYFLFGLLFDWNMEFQGGNYFDIVHIVERFEKQSHMTFAELMDLYGDFFRGVSDQKDLYNITVNWITHQLSSNYHLLYVIAGLPYLFLMLGSLHVITDNKKFKSCITGVLIMLLFVLPKDIFALQNFRFATATWLAIYAIIYYFRTNKYKFAIFLLLTPLIHSSFLFFDIIFLGYVFIKKIKSSVVFIKIFYICSLPFVLLDSSFLEAINLSIFPKYLQEWAAGYLDKGAVEAFGTFQLSSSGLYLLCVFLKFIAYGYGGILLIRTLNKPNMPQNTKHVIIFYLFFAAFTYYCQFIPVLGSRFFEISRILFIYVWFLSIYPNMKWYLWFLLASCSFDILYAGVDHYSRIIAPDFYISSLPTLMTTFI